MLNRCSQKKILELINLSTEREFRDTRTLHKEQWGFPPLRACFTLRVFLTTYAVNYDSICEYRGSITVLHSLRLHKHGKIDSINKFKKILITPIPIPIFHLSPPTSSLFPYSSFLLLFAYNSQRLNLVPTLFALFSVSEMLESRISKEVLVEKKHDDFCQEQHSNSMKERIWSNFQQSQLLIVNHQPRLRRQSQSQLQTSIIPSFKGCISVRYTEIWNEKATRNAMMVFGRGERRYVNVWADKGSTPWQTGCSESIIQLLHSIFI